MTDEMKFLRQLINGCVRYFSDNIGAVLMYHRVAEVSCSFSGTDEYTVRPTRFEQDLSVLDQAFDLVSIQDLLKGLDDPQDLPPRPVSITFDDGYRDTVENALPLLEQYDVPTSVFVTTNFVDSERSPDEFVLTNQIRKRDRLMVPSSEGVREYDIGRPNQKRMRYEELKNRLRDMIPGARRQFIEDLLAINGVNDRWARNKDHASMLTWEQCKTLSEHPLITIGSHGVHHVPLSTWQSKEQRLRELTSSRDVIEEKIGREIHFYSYPYGVCGAGMADEVQEAGYRGAFSTEPDLIHSSNRTQRFRLPRLDASAMDANKSSLSDQLSRLR